MEPWLENLEDDWVSDDQDHPEPPTLNVEHKASQKGYTKPKTALRSQIPRLVQQRPVISDRMALGSGSRAATEGYMLLAQANAIFDEKSVADTESTSSAALNGTTQTSSTVATAHNAPSSATTTTLIHDADDVPDKRDIDINSNVYVHQQGLADIEDQSKVQLEEKISKEVESLDLSATNHSTPNYSHCSENNEAISPALELPSAREAPEVDLTVINESQVSSYGSGSDSKRASPVPPQFRSSPPYISAWRLNDHVTRSKKYPSRGEAPSSISAEENYPHSISTSAFSDRSLAPNGLQGGDKGRKAVGYEGDCDLATLDGSYALSTELLPLSPLEFRALRSIDNRQCPQPKNRGAKHDSVLGDMIQTDEVEFTTDEASIQDSGTFSAISPSEKDISVIPGSSLSWRYTPKRTLNGSFAYNHSSPGEKLLQDHWKPQFLLPLSPIKESQPKRRKMSVPLKKDASNKNHYRRPLENLSAHFDTGSLEEREEGILGVIEATRKLQMDPDIKFSKPPYPSFKSQCPTAAVSHQRGSNFARQTSVRVILASNVKHLIPTRLGDMVFDESSKAWRHEETNSKVSENVPSVMHRRPEDPFQSISDLTEHRSSLASQESSLLAIESTLNYNIGIQQAPRVNGEEGDFWGRTRVEYDLEKDETSVAIENSTTKLPAFLYSEDLNNHAESKNDNAIETTPSRTSHSITDNPADIHDDHTNLERENIGNRTVHSHRNLEMNETVSGLDLHGRQDTGVGRKSFNGIDSSLTASPNSIWKITPAMSDSLVQIQKTPYQPSNQSLISVRATVERTGGRVIKLQKSELSLFNTPLTEISYQFLGNDSRMNSDHSRMYPNKKGTVLRKLKSWKDSLAVGTMVKNLADHDEFGPYWDANQGFTFRARGLKEISQLEYFHPKLVEVNIDDNDLVHLTGMPRTVRDLKVAGNQLSSLTAWGHLQNLQYLDISRNKLENLIGLASLIHLRELKADDNQISSLEGVLHLDGLVKLRLRRNLVRFLDFSRSNLKHLKSLDVGGNDVEDICGLPNLSELAELNLDSNNLDILALQPGQTVRSLRFLNVSNNNLKNFDLSHFPNIKTVYLDMNQLESVHGVSSARFLDSFSMRSQSKDGYLNIPFGSLHEARKIYASSNVISSLQVEIPFANLHYLELASCGLRNLPLVFGRLMINLRVLNLNNNAISDIKPLCGILKLRKLFLIGNRISNLQKISKMLKFHPLISELDLRHNPLTLGFYGVISTGSEIALRDTETLDPSPFLLSPQCKDKDEMHKASMTEDACVARRCYEILIGEQCSQMIYLDGLGFDKEQILRRDWIWEKMAKLGLTFEALPGNDI